MIKRVTCIPFRLFFYGIIFISGAVLATPVKPVPIARCAESKVDIDSTSPASLKASLEASLEASLKGAPAIIYALGKGRRHILEEMLAAGENPNVCVANGSVLSISAASGDLDEVRLLLDYGAHPDLPLDSGGGAPLSAALGMGHFEIAHLLLDRGSDPLRKTDGGITVLHELSIAQARGEQGRAQQSEMATLLIKKGVSVNAQGNWDTTPLMLAVVANNEHLVELLLKYGADPDMKNKRGKNAKDFAANKGNIRIQRLLKITARDVVR